MNTPTGDPSSSWGALTSEFKHNHRKNFHNIHDKYRLLNALKKKKEKQTLGRSKAFPLHSFITNEETSGPKEKKKNELHDTAAFMTSVSHQGFSMETMGRFRTSLPLSLLWHLFAQGLCERVNKRVVLV